MAALPARERQDLMMIDRPIGLTYAFFRGRHPVPEDGFQPLR
jgi:hypothetical protein